MFCKILDLVRTLQDHVICARLHISFVRGAIYVLEMELERKIL